MKIKGNLKVAKKVVSNLLAVALVATLIPQLGETNVWGGTATVSATTDSGETMVATTDSGETMATTDSDETMATTTDSSETMEATTDTCEVATIETAVAESTLTTLTFSDSGVEATVIGDSTGYKIEKDDATGICALTINAAGTYKITGENGNANIKVKKGTTGVVLILSDLDITSTVGAPLAINKNTEAIIHVDGEVTLEDGENPDDENSTDADTQDAYDGAAIKVKSGATATFCGDEDAVLKVKGTAKNGIKGGSESTVIFNCSNYVISAANNGIAVDGLLTINGGNFNIYSDNDAIKSEPDSDDTTSLGEIIINGGIFDIDANGDGIQATNKLTINNGNFDIKTMGGYSDTTFNSDTMSCKGIKVSGASSDSSDSATTTSDSSDSAATTTTSAEAETTTTATTSVEATTTEETTTATTEETCELIINGGMFILDTADDAIHSDAYATITGGTFYIYTGDDGVHSDTTLTLGSNDGLDRDPEIYIYSSYEGLESGTIYTYSGKYYINASDDGVNTAGGSSSGTDPGQGGGNQFGPGGQMPGGNPGENTGSSDYNAYFYGGTFYVNCDGDGLDSNGGLYLYGGNYVVLSQANGGDNSPLDSDGTCVIEGANVFAAGTNPMGENPTSSSQTITYVGGSSMGGFGGPGGMGGGDSSTTYAAGSIITVSNGSTLVYNEKLTKTCNYILYSSPSVSGTVTFATGSTLSEAKGNAFSHSFTNTVKTKGTTTTTTDGSYTIYTTSEGVTTYTCNSCNISEDKTVAATVNYVCNGHEDSVASTTEDEGYGASFTVSGSGSATINVYYTQDYSSADESNVTTAVSRNSVTGKKDSSGSGQINFEVVCDDGYEVESIEVTPEDNYKNLKGAEDTGVTGIYRITKITGAITINVVIKKSESGSGSSGTGNGDLGSGSSDSDSGNSGSSSSSEENGSTDSNSNNSSDETLADGPVVGTKLSYKKYYYKVTKAGSTDGSVVGELAVTGLRKTSVTTIKIAAKVTINGVTYKVTSIKANAFKGNKKVKKVFIGKNIKSIGKAAFAGMSKLRQVSINSTVLTKIGAKAFMNCKKLKKVIIKSKKLKSVGKKAFYRKSGKKLTIKVNSSKKLAYKKLFKKAKTNKYVVK